MTTRTLEAGCDHGDLDLPRQTRIDHCAEDDVGVFMRRFLNHARRLVDFHQRQIRSAGDVDDDTTCTVDRPVFEQRTGNRLLSGLHRPILALRDPGAHHRHAHAGHGGLDIREVQIDQAGHENQVGDALNRLAQHIVGHGERISERRISIDDSEQTLVWNRDDRIHTFSQQLEASFSMHRTSFPLESERLRHDGDCQRAEFARKARNHRRPTRAAASTKAGRDEDHVRAG